jgi:hypothetical protein
MIPWVLLLLLLVRGGPAARVPFRGPSTESPSSVPRRPGGDLTIPPSVISEELASSLVEDSNRGIKFNRPMAESMGRLASVAYCKVRRPALFPGLISSIASSSEPCFPMTHYMRHKDSSEAGGACCYPPEPLVFPG